MKILINLFFLLVINNFTGVGQEYQLNDKYMVGKIILNPDKSYSIELKRGMFYKHSTGYYERTNDKKYIYFTSIFQLDSNAIEREKTNVDSVIIWLKDYNNMPLEGELALSDSTNKSFFNGKVSFQSDEDGIAEITRFNYITESLDTIMVKYDVGDFIKIKSINTMNYDNYLFMNNVRFRNKCNAIINFQTLLPDKKLIFKKIK